MLLCAVRGSLWRVDRLRKVGAGVSFYHSSVAVARCSEKALCGFGCFFGATVVSGRRVVGFRFGVSFSWKSNVDECFVAVFGVVLRREGTLRESRCW